MNRRLLLLGLLAVGATPALARQSSLDRGSPGQGSPDLRPRTSVAPVLVTLQVAERSAALARANSALNSVQRLQGRFVQDSPDGIAARGRFFLERPGRLRFQYDPPSTLLIVSDGRVVFMRDTALRTTERTPLRSTPLHLILDASIDLARDARVTRVALAGDRLLITARDRTGELDGSITLNFVGPSAALDSWDVTDGAGAATRVRLSELTRPASLERSLFRLEDIVTTRPGPRR